MLTGNDALRIRTKLVVTVFVLIFAGLWGRLYYVQVSRHAELYAKARKQYTATRTTTSKRGEIFDINGNLLVGNIPCDDIIADPSITAKDPKKCCELAKLLAARLKLDYAVVHAKLNRKTRTFTDKSGKKITHEVRYAVIARQVPLKVAEKLKQVIYPGNKETGKAGKKSKGFKGIFFNETHKRYYPKGELLANILGFTNVDRGEVVPVLGIESSFNKQISSSKGEVKFERSRDGHPLVYGEKEQVKGHDGWDIYLTVSEPLQAIVEEELEKLWVEWKPRAAYAVMADPYSGNILAVAQRPSFNPNDRRKMDSDSWRSRISSDTFDPGSAMKPVAVSGAIDAGVVTPDTRFDCERGHWVYAGKVLHDAHPLGILTTREIIQKSSNIGTAKIAVEMGKARLNRTLRAFGFGSRTGIQLRHETRGLFKQPEDWDGLSITRFPIGQGISCSPLQLVRAYCGLANRGKIPKLRLIDRIKIPGKDREIKMWIEPPKSIYRNPATWKTMIDMMVLVTREGGTATKAAISGYDVAGKTGTSQKFINGEFSHSKYFATFIGFVPAYQPAFVLLVTADEPKGATYGGTVAAPTFRRIAQRTLRYLDVKPDPALLNKGK
ncbi:MAG: penicillin-binding protein 2 [Victivallaceae bacterium]|nr:penicillin-binding protein 2 [Victivallaceae bacterium]